MRKKRRLKNLEDDSRAATPADVLPPVSGAVIDTAEIPLDGAEQGGTGLQAVNESSLTLFPDEADRNGTAQTDGAPGAELANASPQQCESAGSLLCGLILFLDFTVIRLSPCDICTARKRICIPKKTAKC